MIRHLSITAALVLATTTYAQAQNNKPVRSGTFYEDRANNQSGENGTTFQVPLSFAQVPPDKFLNVTDITCYVSAGASAAPLINLTFNIGTTSGASDTGRIFDIAGHTYLAENANFTYSHVTAKTFIKIGPGRYPSILAIVKTSSPGTIARCTIVGNLTDD